MPDQLPRIAMNRRSLLAGALLMAAAGRSHAGVPPVQSADMVAARAAGPKAASAWIAYELQLRARLADAGGGQFDEDFARALLPEVNGFRGAAKLQPYAWDDGLALCARAHAADMAGRGYFGHASPEGFLHLDRVALLTRELCGGTAENLAWRDYPTGTAPRDMQTLWEQSPGHRRNLLREGYASAGYGVVKVGGAYYAAGVYAQAGVRLASPFPLWPGEGRGLEPALSGASPTIEQLALTPPFQPPTWMAAPSGKMPALQPGAWQLRPLQRASEGHFDVLSGPVFFVA